MMLFLLAQGTVSGQFLGGGQNSPLNVVLVFKKGQHDASSKRLPGE